MIPMTEAEKKRLEQLLSDETDLLMVEVTFFVNSDNVDVKTWTGFSVLPISLYAVIFTF